MKLQHFVNIWIKLWSVFAVGIWTLSNHTRPTSLIVSLSALPNDSLFVNQFYCNHLFYVHQIALNNRNFNYSTIDQETLSNIENYLFNPNYCAHDPGATRAMDSVTNLNLTNWLTLVQSSPHWQFSLRLVHIAELKWSSWWNPLWIRFRISFKCNAIGKSISRTVHVWQISKVVVLPGALARPVAVHVPLVQSHVHVLATQPLVPNLATGRASSVQWIINQQRH